MLPNSPKPASLDFGFEPTESQHHFLIFQKAGADEVYFFEMGEYVEDRDFSTLEYGLNDPLSPFRCRLKSGKWKMIENEVRAEFNRRLKERDVRSAVFKKSGFTHVHRLLGKELLVLVWAIEEADPGTIDTALNNWLGLRPEERWWLYTITNAATGHALRHRGIGWRKALRFALTENPATAHRRAVRETRVEEGFLEFDLQAPFQPYHEEGMQPDLQATEPSSEQRTTAIKKTPGRPRKSTAAVPPSAPEPRGATIVADPNKPRRGRPRKQ